MSYDTEHVRNAGDGPARITGLSTFTALLTNPDLADLYTRIRRSAGITAPELIDHVSISKKTVYDYLHRLERAGLIVEADAKSSGTTSTYEAEAFELALTIRGIEVSITPELVAVIARSEAHPVITRVCDEHGFVVFALAHDLIKAHSEGDITIRQITELADLSTGTVYDLVEAVYAIHDLGDDAEAPTTYTPDDVAGDEVL